MAETQQPAWQQKALTNEPEIHAVRVDGSRIEYRLWGDRADPALIFIHGAAAHANWWDFIAPFFAENYCVIAPHLSGMGNSDHRDAYSSQIFANDVMGIYDQLGLDERTVVIGHSLGGAVALTLAAEQGNRLRAAVMVDSAVFPPGADLPFDPTKAPYRPKTICEDYETAAERFFLLPPQPCEQPHLLEHVVRHSIAEMEGGWSWKFDDKLFLNMTLHDQHAELKNLGCKLAYLHGEHSQVVSALVLDYLREEFADEVPIVEIPDAHHHLLIDQPLALVSTLRTLLHGWQD
ncbi:MAG: alpha/beta hydrolase [Gammaproteobacteria bacterium]|nr:MAG: alpha/beta hydrolase [Gammaproteobacteria bacterium]